MKRISPATVTFGVMAIVLGLVATYIVRQSMRKPVVVEAKPKPPAAPKTKTVVYAKVNLPTNTLVTAADLNTMQVPETSKLLENSIKRPEIAIGRIIKKPIRANSIIREEYLLDIGETLPDLAERLPAGHRALTIHVTGGAPGGRPLEEGDFVDIALTIRGTHPDLGNVIGVNGVGALNGTGGYQGNGSYGGGGIFGGYGGVGVETRTLLHKVLVMDASAGNPVRPVGTSSRGNSNLNNAFNNHNHNTSTILTVAVTEDQANTLMAASQGGTLGVTLVAAKDKDELPADGDTKKRLKDILALGDPPLPPPPPPKPTPPPPPARYMIESYNGSSVRTQVFGEDKIREAEEGAKYFVPSDITESTSVDEDDPRRKFTGPAPGMQYRKTPGAQPSNKSETSPVTTRKTGPFVRSTSPN